MTTANKSTVLSLEDILEGTKNYITSSNYQYSIFINGEWGVGKTYFVRNTLRAKLPKNIRFVYVSLFGITSIQELDEKVSTELFLQWTDKKNLVTSKIGKIVSVWGKSGANIILKKMSLTSKDLPKWYDLVPIFKKNRRKFLFIFDDLERTSCDVIDVLGYINNFIEQYLAKVIIIGNVSKFRSKKEALLVSSSGEHKGVRESINIETKEEEEFSQYREKLIGYQIDFKPDFHEVAASLVSVRDTTYNNKIENNISNKEITELVVSVFVDSQEYNLRTLQNVVGSALKLENLLEDSKYNALFDNKDSKRQFLLTAISRICFIKLTKKPTQNWINSNSQLTQINVDSFEWITKFVNSSMVPRVSFEKSIKEFVITYEWQCKSKQDPFIILKNSYYQLDSEEKLNNLFIGLIDKIKSHAYTPTELGGILILTSKLKAENLIEDESFIAMEKLLDLEIKRINWNYSIYKANYSSPEFDLFGSNLIDEYEIKVKNKYKEWENYIERTMVETVGNQLEGYINKGTMEELKKHIEHHKNDYFRAKRFLSLVKWEILESFLKGATPETMQDFRSIVFKIYSNQSNWDGEELELINRLIKWCISNSSSGNKIVSMQRRWFLNNLNQIQANI